MFSKKYFQQVTLFIASLFLLTSFSACGGGQAVKSDESGKAGPAKEESREVPLSKKYDKIVFQKFEYDPKIEADYPGAVAECENSALAAVKSKKIFNSVAKGTAGAKKAGVLLVRAKVTNLRIVSSTARMWGGAFAGSSDMSLEMKLIDASTGQVVREKQLSTANNPWGAAWTAGSSDKTLPADLGKMVAEYIAAIQPRK
ncbi:MAG: hypothetical protein A4E71_02838 [Smithella sp. PtaU1.Bin162]|nr:MAG: hypothetical protein A4E71_02838 [Smithella sp. PtaU1.Bin162]